ncbi:MAG: amidohydrolase [Methylobacteriaceae bacterium]|nr:amidohydrolase [Methylobacteriaceae bacterium]
MPIISTVTDLVDDVATWRHDFHMHPELLYEVHRTAAIVAEKLNGFGCDEVVEGIGRTGVVGIIRGRRQASRKTIALRADMDALPIQEDTEVPYKSTIDGKMHACGHDGHTAMLLGAARHLCETRNFDGTAAMVFQPAEEGGAGGKAMLDDRLMDRFGIGEVYGMHAMPGLPVGAFAICAGPIMAAADRFEITVNGVGGHAARPHECIDPIMVGAQIVGALQTIAARGVDPLDACVVSITRFHAGEAVNVIPTSAQLGGTIRALSEPVRSFAEARLHEIVEGTAATHRTTATIAYQRGYPVTINDAEKTNFAIQAACDIVGADRIDTALPPSMGAEDFSYMLEARPGAYIFIGNGDGASWHHPAFDFNDAALPFGISYWARLVENRLSL